MPAKFELIAPCFFGCESTAKFELTRIGAENIRVEDGRLSFCGGAEMIAAANLNLRTVEPVSYTHLTPAQVVSLDNFFKGAAYYPKMPDGTLDYENLETLDLPLIKQCLRCLLYTSRCV